MTYLTCVDVLCRIQWGSTMNKVKIYSGKCSFAFFQKGICASADCEKLNLQTQSKSKVKDILQCTNSSTLLQKTVFLNQTDWLVPPPSPPIRTGLCYNFKLNLSAAPSFTSYCASRLDPLCKVSYFCFALLCLQSNAYNLGCMNSDRERNQCTPITQIQLHVVRLCGWIIQHLSEACICKQVDSLLMAFLRGATIDQRHLSPQLQAFPPRLCHTESESKSHISCTD